MDSRRKFLGASTTVAVAAVAGGGIATGADKRLFGTPGSIGNAADALVASHLLKLHLGIEGTPAKEFPSWLAVSQVADDIITDHTAASSFMRDPRGYLDAAGFTGVQFDKESPQYLAIDALANPLVRRAARSGDVAAFLKALDVDGRAPPPLCDQTVCVRVSVDVYLSAALAVVSIAAVAVYAVAVALALATGEVNPKSQSITQLAAITGGKKFAGDVLKTMVNAKMEEIIQGIESGNITINSDMGKRELVQSIRQKMALHFP